MLSLFIDIKHNYGYGSVKTMQTIIINTTGINLHLIYEVSGNTINITNCYELVENAAS